MDLTLSDEQRLLRESVDRFITETYDTGHRRRIASDPLGSVPKSGSNSPTSAGWRCRSMKPMAGSAPARSRPA